MLTRSEMITVSDRHWTGAGYDMRAIKKELEYSWGFNTVQVQLIIRQMQQEGYLP